MTHPALFAICNHCFLFAVFLYLWMLSTIMPVLSIIELTANHLLISWVLRLSIETAESD